MLPATQFHCHSIIFALLATRRARRFCMFLLLFLVAYALVYVIGQNERWDKIKSFPTTSPQHDWISKPIRKFLFTYSPNEIIDIKNFKRIEQTFRQDEQNATLIFNKTLANVDNPIATNLTVYIQGRLGNQLFQYAAAYCIARQNRMQFVYPQNKLGLFQYFDLTAQSCPIISKTRNCNDSGWRVFLEKQAAAYDQRVERIAQDASGRGNIVLEGFYQSWRYFEKCRTDLRREFTFKQAISDAAKRFLHDNLLMTVSRIRGKNNTNHINVTLVGLHVRRKDLFESYNYKFGYRVASINYVEKAMDYFEDIYADNMKNKFVVFVVCSDRPNWFIDHILHTRNSSLVIISKNRTAIEDLALLSLCHHVIATVGTFSWWAGWLSKGTVVYYKKFSLPHSELDNATNRDDFFPATWVTFDV